MEFTTSGKEQIEKQPSAKQHVDIFFRLIFSCLLLVVVSVFWSTFFTLLSGLATLRILQCIVNIRTRGRKVTEMQLWASHQSCSSKNSAVATEQPVRHLKMPEYIEAFSLWLKFGGKLGTLRPRISQWLTSAVQIMKILLRDKFAAARKPSMISEEDERWWLMPDQSRITQGS